MSPACWIILVRYHVRSIEQRVMSWQRVMKLERAKSQEFLFSFKIFTYVKNRESEVDE